MSGWFALKHGIVDHPIFARKPERIAAWVWILDKTAWKDTQQDAGGKTVTVRRGQVLTSFRQMSNATGVSVKTLRGLIDRLRDEDAIDTDMGTGRLLITIRNYEKYQAATKEGAQPKAQEGHSKGTQKEQGNNIPVGGAADAAPDPAKIMFDSGRRILTDAGRSHAEAGRLLGKWRRDHGEEAVIAALGRCQREGAIDPVSFIEGCFKFHRRNQPTERPGYTNAGAFGMIPEVG